MSRDINGTYNLPATNPVVAGGTIETLWANGTMGDIEDELTDSLSRSGYGGMLAPLRATAGTPSVPGISFSTKTDAGLSWSAGNAEIGLSIGSNIARFRAASIWLDQPVYLPDSTPIISGSNTYYPSASGNAYYRSPIHYIQNVAGSVTYLELHTSQVTVGVPLVTNGTASITGYLTATSGLAANGLITANAGVSSTTLATYSTYTAYAGVNVSGVLAANGGLTATTIAASSTASVAGLFSPNGGISATGANTFFKAVHYSDSSTGAIEVKNYGGTGDGALAGMAFHCSGTFATKLALRNDGVFGVGGWSAAQWRWYVNTTNGDMVAAGNVYAYSDRRLKKDLRPIVRALDKAMQITGYSYTRRDTGKAQVGMIADEVAEVCPELVEDSGMEYDPIPIPDEHGNLVKPKKDKDAKNIQTLAYGNVTALLLEALKEMKVKNDILTIRVEALEKKLA